MAALATDIGILQIASEIGHQHIARLAQVENILRGHQNLIFVSLSLRRRLAGRDAADRDSCSHQA